PALTYTQGGRTKTLTLSESEVAEVSAALARISAQPVDRKAGGRRWQQCWVLVPCSAPDS
ncbi:MAG TPA: hypothetical protein VFC16_01975, partial [Nakamurella sp.]|nr:hypothetical protein [Nakamurella sp.]